MFFSDRPKGKGPGIRIPGPSGLKPLDSRLGGFSERSEFVVELEANDVLYVGHVIVEVRREGSGSVGALRIDRAYIAADSVDFNSEIFDRRDPVAREHVRETRAACQARFDRAESRAGSIAVPGIRCTELAGCVYK